MIRRTSFLLSAMSLLPLVLCLATLALWLRSYFAADFISYEGQMSADGRGDRLTSYSSWGGLWFQVDVGLIPPAGRRAYDQDRVTQLPDQTGWMFTTQNPRAQWLANPPTTFEVMRTYGGMGSSNPLPRYNGRALYIVVAVPHWGIAVLFAAFPLLRHIQIRWTRRWLACCRCRACGYGTRAPTKQCPECGAFDEYFETAKS